MTNFLRNKIVDIEETAPVLSNSLELSDGDLAVRSTLLCRRKRMRMRSRKFGKTRALNGVLTHLV